MEPTSTSAPRRIRVLPDHVANMIAAGEVIERPSAVLKELVENALDAGAMNVDVELVAGGRRQVRVSDDGCGMNGDDAVLCFERHATSKITVPGDLAVVHSYGFRGEALPSIASVSRVTLQTCPDESGIGTEVTIHGGQLRTVKEVGRARGTTVIVRDLFFNTPARRKFLRTENTELRHSVREITGLSLGSPKLGFRLAHGGRELLECKPAASWRERVQSLFGRELFLRGIPFERAGDAEGDESARIFGILGRPGDAGGGYSEQYLLVNSRPVQSRLFRKAVLDGYEATLESGKQPSFIVYLSLDPARVDVNVHPQKREVRFRDEREIYRFIRNAVREAFSAAGTNEPHVAPAALPLPEETAPTEGRADGEPSSGVAHFWRGAAGGGAGAPDKPANGGPALPGRVAEGEAAYRAESREAGHVRTSVEGSAGRSPRQRRASKAKPPENGPQLVLNLVSREGSAEGGEAGAEADHGSADSHLWQFQERYIFVSTRDGLWIIDQHVAHERILYEEAMTAFAGEMPASQRLLFPFTIELTPEQDAILEEVMPILESMGFSLQRLSGRSVMIDAYPNSAESREDGGLLREMIDEIAEVGFKRTGVKEQIAASFACHAAVKSGEPLTPRKMRWIIERLFTTSMPYVCPHGRPIVVKIDMAEFDQRFGRT